MYAFTTQTSEVSVKARSSRIDGRATFTMVVSSTIISSPRQRTMSASQRFRWSRLLVTIISPLSFLLLLLEVLLHLAKAIDRFARSEVLQLEELPDLDLGRPAVDGGIGKTSRPLHRLFTRLHLDDGVAGDELLRLGEGPVHHGALATRVFDAPALGARLQARGIEQHPGFLQLLVILLHLRHELLGGHHARFRVLRGLDYDHESHAVLRCLGAGPPGGSGRMQSLALTVRRTRLCEIDSLNELFSVRPHLPHQPARRVEDARPADLAFADERGVATFCGHASSPRRSGRRGARGSRSSPGSGRGRPRPPGSSAARRASFCPPRRRTRRW